MTDLLRLDFTGAKEKTFGPTDWLTFILKVNEICDLGGALELFGDPDIQPASLTTPYSELYPEARVELDDDGRSTARIFATSEHAASVFRAAAAQLGLTVIEPPPEQTADEVREAVIALWNAEGGWIPGAAFDKLAEVLRCDVDRLTHWDVDRGRVMGQA